MRFPLLMLGTVLTASACQTTQLKAQRPPLDEASAPIFDGVTDQVETLPDCDPEMVGSVFWVSQEQRAMGCTTDGTWVSQTDSRIEEGPEDEESPRPRGQ